VAFIVIIVVLVVSNLLPMSIKVGSEYSTSSSSCSWYFLRYEPSALEEKWMQIVKSNPKGQGMCADIHSPTHANEMYQLVRTTMDFAAKKRPSEANFLYYSKMVYEEKCENENAPSRVILIV
jgi:hypothetical protein